MARGFMIRRARDLALATVTQVLGDPGALERVVANLRADTGGERVAADYPIYVGLGAENLS